MSKKLDSCRRNAERTAASSAKKAGRVEETQARIAARILKAEEAVTAAQRRLEKVKADAAALIAKRKEEATKAATRAAEAAQRLMDAANKPVKPTQPAGTVTTENGQSYSISKAAVDAVKQATGRKRSGTLSPDGEPAHAMLNALDSDTSGHTGDTFTVSLKGRKTQLRFTVTPVGLSFATTSVATATAIAA